MKVVPRFFALSLTQSDFLLFFYQKHDYTWRHRVTMEYKQTLNMTKSGFPMRGGLPMRQPDLLKHWEELDLYNELLKKNADMLKMGTIATAKEAERSIVDIETLQHTNERLVSTLDEVVNIQREGAQQRKEAEVELRRIEGEFKQRHLGLRS